MSLAHAPTPRRAWRFQPKPHPNAGRNAEIVRLWTWAQRRRRTLSYSDIGRKIGCTRNVVAGVLDRARARGQIQ